MKRRRISNQLIEETIQGVCPFYKLEQAYRPDGEYINESKFVFQLTEEKEGYPKRFTIVDKTKEESRLDFMLKYSEDEKERIKGADLYYIITNIKTAIKNYSGFLDISQVNDVVKRAFAEVFTESYLQQNERFFKMQADAISHFYCDMFLEHSGVVKSGVLYRKLKEEMIYMPMRSASGHFVFTFNEENDYDRPDRTILPGEIYSVYLPIGDDSELGGGNKRPCLIIGKSSTNRYFVSPLHHSENENTMDEEYFLDNDLDGRPRYVTRGVVYSVAPKDIFTALPRCKKEDYERILDLISRDNYINPGIGTFKVGLGSASSGDIYKSQINYYERHFQLPQPEEFMETISYALRKIEKKSGKQLFAKKDKGFAYETMPIENGYLLKIPRVGEKVPLVIKLDKTLPIDVFSNRKELEYGVVGNHEFSADVTIMGSYRYCMSKKYPMFKCMILRRLVKLFNAHYHSDKFAGNDDCAIYAERLETVLNSCSMEYEGDYQQLIKEGIESIDFKKLRFVSVEVLKEKQARKEEEEQTLE